MSLFNFKVLSNPDVISEHHATMSPIVTQAAVLYLT